MYFFSYSFKPLFASNLLHQLTSRPTCSYGETLNPFPELLETLENLLFSIRTLKCPHCGRLFPLYSGLLTHFQVNLDNSQESISFFVFIDLSQVCKYPQKGPMRIFHLKVYLYGKEQVKRAHFVIAWQRVMKLSGEVGPRESFKRTPKVLRSVTPDRTYEHFTPKSFPSWKGRPKDIDKK